MNSSLTRTTASAFAALLSIAALPPAQAAPGDDWVVDSNTSYCSIGTKQDGAFFILMTTSSGASGLMIKPADQSLITAGTDYKLKININGSADIGTTANAGDFGGVKVLHIELNGAKIAAGEPDGFAFRVRLGDTIVFDKDMHGSHDAFAAFVACSKKFGAE